MQVLMTGKRRGLISVNQNKGRPMTVEKRLAAIENLQKAQNIKLQMILDRLARPDTHNVDAFIARGKAQGKTIKEIIDHFNEGA